MNVTATKSAGKSPAKSTTKTSTARTATTVSAQASAEKMTLAGKSAAIGAKPKPTATAAKKSLAKANVPAADAPGKPESSDVKTAAGKIAAARSAAAGTTGATRTAASKASVKNSGNQAVTTQSDDQSSDTVGVTARSPAEAAAFVTQHNDAQLPADTIQLNVVSKAQEVATKTMKSSSATDANKHVLTEEELVKMGEKDYMNSAQLAFFKARLQQLEKDLLRNAGETTEHLRETVLVPDPADRATIEEEHALELRTRDRERKLLKKVQQSIASIDAGDYGWCDETGEPIGIPRLLARPTATLSVEAQQRRELKQKLYGD